MMKLFYSPNACSLASHIVLEEAGADYELALVDVRAGAQLQPDYLAVNPKARVPALAVGGQILTETPTILAYIAQTHPGSRLAPLDDPFAFARMQGFNNYISSTLHVAYAHIFRGPRWANAQSSIDDMAAKGPEVVAKSFELIETTMAGPWILGEAYSTADPYLYVMCRWTTRAQIDLGRFPNIQTHMQRIAERPAVKRALAQEGLS
ncbi:MAG: glutathione S-transferase N-terminal domain-containing protein [Caulobacteraceae bacterium]